MEKKTKNKVTGVRLPPDMLEALETLAKADGRTLSNMIIKILRDWLDGQAPSPKS